MTSSSEMTAVATRLRPLQVAVVLEGIAIVVFGPYTAAMTSTLGLGGLLAGVVKLNRPAVAAGAALTLSGCGLVLAVSHAAAVLIAAQVVLVGLLVTIGIHLSRLLHDLVPSEQRSGVSSGIGTLSWLTFLPCSLLFGALSTGGGVPAAGWIITALVTICGAILVRLAARRPGHRPVDEIAATTVPVHGDPGTADHDEVRLLSVIGSRPAEA
jgi:hypothetical protein